MYYCLSYSYAFLIFWILFACFACKTPSEVEDTFNYLDATKSPQEIQELSNKIDRAYYAMLGQFSSKAQSMDKDEAIYNEQEVISVPIWQKRKGEHWFYMGWFKADFVEHALLEGIFELRPYERDTFILRFYDIPQNNEVDYTHEWKEPKPFKDLSPQDLGFHEGCESFLIFQDKGVYKIASVTDYPCAKNISFQIQYFQLSGKITFFQQKYFNVFYNEELEEVLKYPKPFGLMLDRMSKDYPKY